jgi:hypothetical protein
MVIEIYITVNRARAAKKPAAHKGCAFAVRKALSGAIFATNNHLMR